MILSIFKPKIWSFIFCISLLGNAQGQHQDDISVHEKKVRTLENFVERFNNQPEGSGMPQPSIPSNTTDLNNFQVSRFNNLYSLFDHQIFTGVELARNAHVANFIKTINTPVNPTFLTLNSPEWGAELHLKFNDPPFEVSGILYLQLVRNESGSTKWVIRSISIRSLDLHEVFKGQSLEFPGFVHGMNFTPLRISLIDPKWIERNKQPDGNPSRFMEALLNQDLKVRKVEDPIFSFYQIKGWRFFVCYRNRESRNTGWLIFKLDQINQEEVNKELIFKGLKQ